MGQLSPQNAELMRPNPGVGARKLHPPIDYCQPEKLTTRCKVMWQIQGIDQQFALLG